MALHFILDGYNIIKQSHLFADLNIDVGRERFIRAIERFHPQGSSRNQVTVFFDGRPGNVDPVMSSSVKVVFSYDDSADDRIRDLVADSGNARNIVVVSDDREVQSRVKALGAEVLSVNAFMARFEERSNAESGKSPGGLSGNSKTISKTLEFEINREMEKIWLEKQKHK